MLERKRHIPYLNYPYTQCVDVTIYDFYCPHSLSLYSASMKDKLPLVKESLRFMVQQLREEDKLALITFDHEVQQCVYTVERVLDTEPTIVKPIYIVVTLYKRVT